MIISVFDSDDPMPQWNDVIKLLLWSGTAFERPGGHRFLRSIPGNDVLFSSFAKLGTYNHERASISSAV